MDRHPTKRLAVSEKKAIYLPAPLPGSQKGIERVFSPGKPEGHVLLVDTTLAFSFRHRTDPVAFILNQPFLRPWDMEQGEKCSVRHRHTHDTMESMQSVISRAEIVRKLETHLQQREEILFAYIYGSFVEYRFFRDIDIAVFVKEDRVPHEKALEYQLHLTALTEQNVGVTPLDIRVINYAPVGFRYYATKGILLFSRDEEVRCNFLEDTWRRYFDLLPKRKQILLDILAP